MPKYARLVVPDYPHHVTQRGVRRQRTFFDDGDYRAYLGLIKKLKSQAGVEIWSYCLMPNHIHIIAVPKEKQSLSRLFGTAHHRYAKLVNSNYGWRGHLWQERFYSVAMDEPHTLAAMRYIELNPVRAGLCVRADQWPWSSVHGHMQTQDDELLDECELSQGITDWPQFLTEETEACLIKSLRIHTSSGRPVGDECFINRLEATTGRRIRLRKPGPARQEGNH